MSQVSNSVSYSSVKCFMDLCLDWDEAHGPVIIKRSHKPRVSEQRAKPLMWHSDYHLPDNHHYNNFYDGGYDDNVNGDP